MQSRQLGVSPDQARHNRQAIQEAMLYGRPSGGPPYMPTSHTGMSGHKPTSYVSPTGSSIPPATPSPFADQFAGTKTLKFMKMIFHSSNKTPDSKSNADYTVDIDKETLNNLQIGMISLSDIVFPAGQYTIEDDWNHIDFNEGIVPTSFFRDIIVRYKDLEDPDSYYLEQKGILPLTFNAIETIIVEDEATNMYRFRTAEPFGSDINYMQDYYSTNLFIGATRFNRNGQQPLAKSAGVRVSPVTAKHRSNELDGRTIENTIQHEFRGQLPSSISSALAELNPIIDSDCLNTEVGGLGYLIATPFADPSALAQVATNLLNLAITYRKHRFDPDDVRATTNYHGFQYVISWDPIDDRFYIQYQLTSPVSPEVLAIPQEDMPVIYGPIFQYMGFKVPFQLPSFNGSTVRKVPAQGRVRTSPFSGTRVEPGHYLTGGALAAGIEEAMNGTWFGVQGTQPNISNPQPFVVSVNFGGSDYTVRYCPGRYTPFEIANIFNSVMTSDYGMPILMTPIFDGFIWLGMRFHFDGAGDRALPFALPFGDSTLMSLDPRRLGYKAQNYRGKTAYYPVNYPPAYPTIVQYDFTTFVPAVQHYRVRYDDYLRRLSITAEPFAPELACVTSVTDDPDCQVLVLALPIAHGAVAGQHLYLSLIPEGNALIDSVECPAMVECTEAAVVLRENVLSVLATDPDVRFTPDDLISCVVLPSKSLDDEVSFYRGYDVPPGAPAGSGAKGALAPTQLRVSFGGTRNSSIISDLGQALVGRKMVVNFSSPNMWSWNCSWNVSNCIQRQVVGVDPVYYVFTSNYPLAAADSAYKDTTYVFGTDAFANPSVPKDAHVLVSTMAFPMVTQGLVLSDVSTFNCPHVVTLFPFKDVYLIVTLNAKDGDGNTIGLQTTKTTTDQRPTDPVRRRRGELIDESARAPGLVNGSQINALAHILIGARAPYGIVDLHDRLFEIQYVGVQKLSTMRFQWINPDGTPYHFHGKENAVGLLLSTVQEHMVTTQ